MRTFIAASLLAVGLLATGCSSSGTEASSSSASASSSVSASTQMLPPLEIDGQTAIDAKIGDNLNVVTEGASKVATSDVAVLTVSQPRDDGSAQFNAGGKAIAPGTATLTVSGDAGELYRVQVTVTN